MAVQSLHSSGKLHNEIKDSIGNLLLILQSPWVWCHPPPPTAEMVPSEFVSKTVLPKCCCFCVQRHCSWVCFHQCFIASLLNNKRVIVKQLSTESVFPLSFSAMYLAKDSSVPNLLQRLSQAGKKLFLITNSGVQFVYVDRFTILHWNWVLPCAI